ncbi:MAG: 4-hydroxy-2-oxoheptanedioate aldolase [Acidimicrobiaceae bacterium]|nr:4-hydroxy-2-oxoheptanedioate aldolase [Acidimicrobiaceae bacterium]
MTEMRSLRKLWDDGGTALGAWISLREPFLAEIAATSGYDYVCIDMQHGLSDYDDVVGMLQAMARTPTAPVVRVPWNEQGIIGRVLDAGALGVIIPMVNTPDEARRAVEACRYAPAGSRSFGPLAVAARYGSDYMGRPNDVVACIPMIETKQAVEAIDDILAVPGIDAVYIGPADLSITYGLAPGIDNPDQSFVGALETVVASCLRHGVVPGIHSSAELAAKRHAGGFRLITVGFDAAPAMQALRADAKAARAAVTPA